MWRRKHNRRSSMSAACPSSRLIMPLERLTARLAPRLVFRSAPRLVLLACLICVLCGSHRLVVSSARLSLGGLLPPHRLIGSPSASYRPAPRPIRQAGLGGTKTRSAAADGERLLACSWDGDRRWRADGGWLAWRAGCLLVPLGGDGMERLGCFSFPLIGSSNRRGPSSSSHHLIISSSHRRGGAFFSFSPDPLLPALLGLLALTCSPVPGRGM